MSTQDKLTIVGNTDISKLHLDFFVVMNKEGNFFRAKGYGGSGNSWIENITDAKIYGNLGAARRIVTFWASSYPDYGIPYIIKLSLNNTEILLDEIKAAEKRINKKKIAKEQEQVRQSKYDLEAAKRRVIEAEKELKIAISNIKNV